MPDREYTRSLLLKPLSLLTLLVDYPPHLTVSDIYGLVPRHRPNSHVVHSKLNSKNLWNFTRNTSTS